MNKEYIACSECRFYPFCRIKTAINELNDRNDFIKRGEKTSSQYIAEICRFYKKFKVIKNG